MYGFGNRVLSIVLVLSLVAAVAAHDSTESDAQFSDRVLALTDVILDQHIDPPARQQMILNGAKALYNATGEMRAPQGLSSQISKLVDRDQISAYLQELAIEFKELKQLEGVFTSGILAGLPGGARILDADAAEIDEQVRANRYVGIGIALAMHGGAKRPVIGNAFKDGPAWGAGLRSQDLILEIEGQSTEGKPLADIVTELRGEAGTDVTLVVSRPDLTEKRTATMTRGRVFIPTVHGLRRLSSGDWKFTLDDPEDVAMVRIQSFGPSTLHELRQIAEKLADVELKGVIVDLRAGSGMLHDTVVVADSLLDGGVIGHVQMGAERVKHEARPGALFPGVPMVVLTARHASPSSVLLTAALQDNDRAIVVGEISEGRPYVNSILSIPNRRERIVMATGVMFRGDGTPLVGRPNRAMRIQQVPVEHFASPRPQCIVPDHLVPATDPTMADAMVGKAISLLHGEST